MGPPGVGQPQHNRRSAPQRNEGDRQRQDQVQGAVPALRSLRAGGAGARIFRDRRGRRQVSVAREANPRYYSLIESFGQLTGVPVLLNTSFNLRGEPIVNTPAEAYSTFARSGIDMLVLGDYLVRK